MSAATTPGGDRVWFAQGLRGVAATLVAVDHLFLFFWLQSGLAAAYAHTRPVDDPVDSTVYGAARALSSMHLSLGMLGVAVFFLISGFVIPMSLERLRGGRFLIARAFRIYPTYLAGLAVIALFVALASGGFPWSLPTVLANGSLLRDWTWSEFIAPVSWSLEVEIKFYVLCALVVAVSSLARSRALVIAAAAGCAVAAAADAWAGSLTAASLRLGQIAYVLSDDAKYMAFMLLGVCFYNHFRGHWGPRRALATGGMLLALAVCSFAFSPQAPYWRHYLTGYGLALAIFAGGYLIRARLPYLRPMNFLADISYPLYVVHQVVGFVLITAFHRLHPVPVLNALEALACTIVIAYALHRLVEVPSNRLGKRLARGRARPALPSPVAEAPPAAAAET